MAPPFRLSMLLLFIALPLIEIALFIKVGGEIGSLWTILIVICTAVVGTWLLQAQGFGVLARVRSSVLAGEMPIEPVIESVLLLLAGAFLLTPGLLTDAIGFVLLIPPIRIVVARYVLKRALKQFMIFPTDPRNGRFGEGSSPNQGGPSRRSGGGQKDGEIIDGEFERVDENTIDPDRRP